MQQKSLWAFIRLPPVPESVPRARRFVQDQCAEWGLEAACETAVLIASELATNSVRHARSPVTVWLARRPDRIVLSVEDNSALSPTLDEPAEMDEGGRGLVLVDTLSERWGERELPSGKRVWAEIATTAEAT